MQYITFRLQTDCNQTFHSPSFSIKYVLYFLYFYQRGGQSTAHRRMALKILFVTLPRQLSRGEIKEVLFKSPPITFVWLAAFLKEAGHDAVILDGYSKALGKDDILDGISAEAPDMVGFTSFTCEYPDVIFMASAVKGRFPGMRIVIGGYHANSLPEDFFVDAVDYVFSGEAEESLPEFMTRLEAGRTDFDGLSSLHYRNVVSGEWVSNPKAAFIPDFSHIPLLPYELIDGIDYNTWWKVIDPKKDRYMATVTGKGCPMGCSFCDISKTEGKRYRSMSA